MADFLNNLFQSIFTPGPTPTLIVATNAAFAALQVVLIALLIATYSIHFIILSFLCGGLWYAINWFVTELEAAKEKEVQARRLRDIRKEREEKIAEDSGTETEDAVKTSKSSIRASGSGLSPPSVDDKSMKKRRSLGETSGDLSTDSEWDKVEDEGDVDR